MSSYYKISEEEINKILLSSPMVLPNNPSEKGMKAGAIKEYFYKFVRIFAQILNEHLANIEFDKNYSISQHNESDSSHNDVRELLTSLAEKDAELGNIIEEKLNKHNNSIVAHLAIRQLITESIKAHDENASDSHMPLRDYIGRVGNIAREALSLASGKSRIIPTRNINEMLMKIESAFPEIEVGDRFILLEENVPDFTVYEKNSTNEDAKEISKEYIQTNPLKAGKTYLFMGYLLVASESGLDTSQLAKQSDIAILTKKNEELLNTIAELESALMEALSKKESTIDRVSTASELVTIENKTEYNLGLRASVILSLPEEIADDYEAIVNFRSGAVPTAFDAPSEILFVQDDCVDNMLYPVSNRIYEISIKRVDGIIIARVGCADYEVV